MRVTHGSIVSHTPSVIGNIRALFELIGHVCDPARCHVSEATNRRAAALTIGFR